MEHFYTLQGEGYHQGKAAYFIRLGGCDVGCVWCDVKESWDADKHPLFKIEDLIFNISNTSAELVVVTGGEPLMHNLDELTASLLCRCDSLVEPPPYNTPDERIFEITKYIRKLVQKNAMHDGS